MNTDASTNAAPVAAGPLNHVHRASGAALEVVDGWEILLHYPAEPPDGSNVIVDVSHRRVHEINGPNTGEVLRSLCGEDLPLRWIYSDKKPGFCAYRLTESRAIVFGGDEISAGIDVTGGWTSLALFGPDRLRLLSKVTAVDLRDEALPVGRCLQGPVFGVGTLIGRFENCYELHVCPDVLEFLWEVMLDAGREFQLQPAGFEYYRRCNENI